MATLNAVRVCKDQVPEHVIDQVKCKSSLDCFQLFCIWHTPTVLAGTPSQLPDNVNDQVQHALDAPPQEKLLDRQQSVNKAPSSPRKKQQTTQKKSRSADLARQLEGIDVTHQLASIWRTLPTREKNVYRKLVPVLLRKQADTPGQKEQLEQCGPEAKTSNSPTRKLADSASNCQGKGVGLSPTFLGAHGTPVALGNASGPKSDNKVEDQTALAGAAAVHEAKGIPLAEKLNGCSAACSHEPDLTTKTSADELSPNNKKAAVKGVNCPQDNNSNDNAGNIKNKKMAAMRTSTMATSSSIEIPRSESPVLLAGSVLSGSPNSGLSGLYSTKEMALSGLHATADLEQHLLLNSSCSMTKRKTNKKKAKKKRQAAVQKREAEEEADAANKASKAQEEAKNTTTEKPKERKKHVRFNPMAEVFAFERAQGGSAVPIEGSHPLTLGKFIAKSLVPLQVELDPSSTSSSTTVKNVPQRKGSKEQQQVQPPKIKRRHPCHGPKEEELTPLEEKQRVRLLRHALGAQWDDKEEVRLAALETKECQTIRNSRAKNCCDCGTGKNKTSRCDTAKCACHRAGVGCHAEGTSYCQCTIRCCQNAEGRYQFRGAVVNKARKKQISEYWAFVVSAEYQLWSPQSPEFHAFLGLIDWSASSSSCCCQEGEEQEGQHI